MGRVLTAFVAVVALVIGVASPSGGQQFGDPEFGPLAVTPEEGNPGDLVDAQVDASVVAADCVTDPAVVVDQFGEMRFQVTGTGTPTGPVLLAWVDHFPLIGIDTPSEAEVAAALTPVYGPAWPFFAPIPPGGPTLYWWAGIMEGLFYHAADPFDIDREQQAALLLTWLMSTIGIGVSEVTESYLAETFVLTFADIATQTPVGEITTFDPATGAGEVTVPDVAPGLAAVAATCVEPMITDESFAASIAAGIAYLDSVGSPLIANPTACVDDPGGGPHTNCDGQGGFLAEGVGAAMLPELMGSQDGVWVELFCVSCDPLESVNDVAAFCGVLPEVQGLPDRLEALFTGVDIDDPATYPSVDALEALGNDVALLLDLGDSSVPLTVQPQWSIATEDLRDLRWGLPAVSFDFQTLVDFAPGEAERLIEIGTGEGEPDPEFDAAIEVLTAFFLDNCITGGPAAPPVDAVARFAG